ncbi:MAG: bifunctional oligoribonuclease/PAP phosphatase NrnA [Clostridiales bacterium]|nr:bifunctional oligoribonuclease/PAP phosphatase NrnA [Clostridiales bacterium]
MKSLESILSIIQQSKQIAVFCHVQPDGDAIGSCLALASVLTKMGKLVDLYCQDEVPVSLHFLQGIEQFKNKYNEDKHYDLCIALDCSDEERIGIFSDVYRASAHTMNIDHHISNTMYADINLVDFKAAATGEIIYKLVRAYMDILDEDIAEALYTAISTDTGGFRYRNTTSQSYRIAADLIECGIDVEKITTLLYKTNRLERVRLLERGLKSLTLYYNNKIAIITITQDDLLATGAIESEMENMVNYAKDIIGVEIGILIKEVSDGTVRSSFRSKGEIDVSKLAKHFNGGGHKAAAGASLDMNVEQATASIIEQARIALEEYK